MPWRRAHWAKDEVSAEIERTCPRYFAQTPFVGSLLYYLSDYENGALGPIWDLPAAFVDYCKVALGERTERQQQWEWEAYNTK
jgi:hypothetical protein